MFYRTKFILLALLLVAVAGLTSATLQQSSRLVPAPNVYGSIAYPASLNALLAGCGSIYTFTPEEKNVGTIPTAYEGDIFEAPIRVSTFGYFIEEKFPADAVKAYPKDFEGFPNRVILRAMWQGNDVMWVDADVTDEAYAFATDFVNDWNKTHDKKIMMLPWIDNDRPLPEDRMVAFASWGSSQSCEGLSPTVFEEYEAQVDKDLNGVNNRDKKNPPAAPLDDAGSLFEFRQL